MSDTAKIRSVLRTLEDALVVANRAYVSRGGGRNYGLEDRLADAEHAVKKLIPDMLDELEEYRNVKIAGLDMGAGI